MPTETTRVECGRRSPSVAVGRGRRRSSRSTSRRRDSTARSAATSRAASRVRRTEPRPPGWPRPRPLFAHYGHPVHRASADRSPAVGARPGRHGVRDRAARRSPTTTTRRCSSSSTAGGRLVIGGSDPFYLRSLRDHPPAWSPDGAPVVLGDRATARRVRTIADRRRRGSWTSPGSGTVARARRRRRAAHRRTRRARARSSSSPTRRRSRTTYLGPADNAAFALALAGDADAAGRVRRRRARLRRGARARRDPDAWKVALVILAAAAVVFAWSRSRRFGPPDRPARDLPPPRAEYVRALAVTSRAHARSRARARAAATMGAWPHRAARAPAAATRRPRRSTAPRSRSGSPKRSAPRSGTRRPTTTAALALGPARRALVASTRGERVNELRDRVVREVRKVVVGQDGVVEVLLAAVTVGGHLLLEGVPGVAKTLAGERVRPRDRRRVPARAVHARHAAVGPHRHDDAARRASSRSGPGRCSPTCCSPTRSTARRRRRRPRCSRRCRSAR